MNNELRVGTVNKSASISLTKDLSSYYSDLSKKWAISSSVVENNDYSAKYYANKASEEVENAKAWAVKTDGMIDGNEYSAKYYAQQAMSVSASKADIDFSNISETAKEVIRENAGTSSGGGSWGSITGTITEQEDLSTALSEKASLDLSNCTRAYLLESSESASGWYRKWSDGWLEQGGGFNAGSAAKGAVILPKAYNSSSYNCLLTVQNSSTATDGSTVGNVWVSSLTNSMFRWVNSGSECVIFWATYGYSA